MIYYKTLSEGGKSPFPEIEDHPTWSLPRNGTPGEWMPYIKDIVLDGSGYHFTDRYGLSHIIRDEMYKVEPRGYEYRLLDDHGRATYLAHEIRLTRRIDQWTPAVRLFVIADFVEHALGIFEKEFPSELPFREQVIAIRRRAVDDITDAELIEVNAEACRWAQVHYPEIYDAGYVAGFIERTATNAVANAVRGCLKKIGADVDAEYSWQSEILFQYLNRPVSESLEIARAKLEAA